MLTEVSIALLYGLITEEQAKRINDNLTLLAVIRANPEPTDPVLSAVKFHFGRNTTYFERQLICGRIEITINEKSRTLEIDLFLWHSSGGVRHTMAFRWNMGDNIFTSTGNLKDISDDHRGVAIRQLSMIAGKIPQIATRLGDATA